MHWNLQRGDEISFADLRVHLDEKNVLKLNSSIKIQMSIVEWQSVLNP